MERFQCPECGESIPIAAEFCRSCNAIITDADRKKAKWGKFPQQKSQKPKQSSLIPVALIGTSIVAIVALLYFVFHQTPEQRAMAIASADSQEWAGRIPSKQEILDRMATRERDRIIKDRAAAVKAELELRPNALKEVIRFRRAKVQYEQESANAEKEYAEFDSKVRKPEVTDYLIQEYGQDGAKRWVDDAERERRTHIESNRSATRQMMKDRIDGAGNYTNKLINKFKFSDAELKAASDSEQAAIDAADARGKAETEKWAKWNALMQTLAEPRYAWLNRHPCTMDDDYNKYANDCFQRWFENNPTGTRDRWEALCAEHKEDLLR